MLHRVEGRLFYGHKIVLVSESSRLRAMLAPPRTSADALAANAPPLVQINDIRYHIFEQVMKYLYSGGCAGLAVPESDVLEVLAAASFFQLLPLQRHCEARAAKSVDLHNLVSVYIHAKVYGATQLLEYCQGFLLQNMVALLTYDDSVKRLLFGKRLPGHNVLSALLTTLQKRIESRKNQAKSRYSPDARQEPPRWACALCALGVFVYQSLDAIDGKQARRTGSQSPLGELFDHGCDSISTVFIALGACIAVKLGDYPTWMFFQCFCAMTLFYCAHWQAYVTGTLKMGRIDVTEAQYAIIVIHLISAILGPDVWTTQVGSLEMRYSLGGVAVAGAALTLAALAAAIAAGGVGKNGSTVAVSETGYPRLEARLSRPHAYPTSDSKPQLMTFLENKRVRLLRRVRARSAPTAVTAQVNGWVQVGSLEMRYSLGGVAVAGAALTLAALAAAIAAGGVGKNGSTVAVSETGYPRLEARLSRPHAYPTSDSKPQLMTFRSVNITGVEFPLGVHATAFTVTGALYFIANFTATFRDRGCGKNGSTVAVRPV
ncbi:jg11430 [Pararge aegeria aegeria]|uniref:diacylglycerol cholinephosphotransferase n=1 Tax=Pararge aegeria aegeria TaxID=348720 RepID=A0A8S4RZI4_9NEOP|nr:jg11430 [Pararge aegeria aegeria]